MSEMLDKFNEDFAEALYWAARYKEIGAYDKNTRYVYQAKDFAFLAFHFGIIDESGYDKCLEKVDKCDLMK